MVFVVLCPETLLFARQPGIRFEHCGVRQGLSQGSGYTITQDQDGFIWMGTQKGLNRYDGYGMKVYYNGTDGFTGNDYITSLLTDSSGNVWVASKSGLSILDNQTRKFVSAGNFLKKPSELDSIHIKRVWQDASKNTWLLSISNGAYCIHPDKSVKRYFTNHEADNLLVGMAADRSGATWLTMSHALYRFDNTRQQFTRVAVPGISDNIVISAFLIDNNDQLWIGTFDDGVYILATDGSVIKHIAGSDNGLQSLSSNDINTMLQDKQHNIWIGTRSGGLNKYLPETGRIIQARHEEDISESLNRNFVLSLFEDSQGCIWAGLSGGGFDKYNPYKYRFELFRHTQNNLAGIPDNMVLSIRRLIPGYIHFGTQNAGLAVLDEATGKFSHFTKQTGNSNSLIHNTVYDMTIDGSGIMWIATWGGLCSYNPVTKTFFEFNNAQKQVTNLYTVHVQKNKNILWVSGDNGTFRLDITSKQWLPWDAKQQSQKTGSQVVRVFYEDENGNIWMGTESNGLLCYIPQSNELKYIPVATVEGNSTVRCIRPGEPGSLWIGSDNGWMKLDMRTKKIVQRYNSANGLPDDVVYSMERDKLGNWWIGTNKGLANFVVSSGSFRPYDESDGLQSDEFNTNCSYADPSGKLWFGGINGANAFDPSELPVNFFTPDIRFTSVKILDTVRLDELSVSREKELVLNHNQNLLSFEFAALNYMYNERDSYFYMLEGRDADWRKSGTRRTVTYTDLQPGHYTFKVRYESRDGVSSGNIATLSIVINPPWWLTWWAYTIYGVVACAVVYAFYRARINALQRKQTEQIKTMVATQENERKRLSRDLHDDIGTKLSAIKLYISSLEHKLKENDLEEAGRLAENSGQMINETMADVRKMLLNLSPDILEEFGYATAVEALVNKINETKMIHFDLVTFGFKRGLPKDHELALYRITQELINNVLKHAEATQVSLQIGYRDEKIILLMEDNGKGFDVYAHKNGYGLKNLEARTQMLKGRMEIDSQPGKGTGVLIEVPYKFSGNG